MGLRWRRASCVLFLTTVAGCGAHGAPTTTPEAAEARATRDVHPVIEAYTSTLRAWMTDDERRRLEAIDTHGTMDADPARLRAIALDRFVHRMLPAALESQSRPDLSRQAVRLRETPSIETEGGGVVAAREIDASLQALRTAEGRAAPEPDPEAQHAYAEAYAEYAEVYARVMGVSEDEADAAAASVADVVEVALVAGRLVERHGAEREPVVHEALGIVRAMARLGGAPGTSTASGGAEPDARHASTHRLPASPRGVR